MNHYKDLSPLILSNSQVKYLGGFYNDKLKCFQHSSTANQRVSISSTCLGISAMFKVFVSKNCLSAISLLIPFGNRTRIYGLVMQVHQRIPSIVWPKSGRHFPVWSIRNHAQSCHTQYPFSFVPYLTIAEHWRREPLFAPLLLVTMMRLGEPASSKLMISVRGRVRF